MFTGKTKKTFSTNALTSAKSNPACYIKKITKSLHLKEQTCNTNFQYKDFLSTKLLQKREMRKDIVIELSYKGFSRASDYS